MKIDVDAKDFQGTTALHRAARGNNNAVEILLDQFSANIEECNDNGQTALHMAVQSHHHAANNLVELLLSKGAAVDRLDYNKRTHIYYAHDVEVVKALIADGADVCMIDNCGDTPLHVAARKRDFDVIKAMIDAGADLYSKNALGQTARDIAVVEERASYIINTLRSSDSIECMNSTATSIPINYTALLYEAAAVDNVTRISELIAQEAAVNAIHEIKDQHGDQVGQSALHIACKSGFMNSVKTLLIIHAADPEVRTNEQRGGNDTPLSLACSQKNIDIVKLLLAQGAQSTSVNDCCRTALHFATDIDIARQLLMHGVNIDALDKDLDTALHWAATCIDTQHIAKLLIHKGACVTVMNSEQQTPLYNVASAAVASLLATKGASLDHYDNEGNTPLHWTVSYNVTDISPFIVQALLQKGASVDLLDSSDMTALHTACYSSTLNSVSFVKLLIAAKADVNFRSGDGQTCLQIAIQECIYQYKKQAQIECSDDDDDDDDDDDC
eukprot:11568-Heterococcus_DN1.PRE.1